MAAFDTAITPVAITPSNTTITDLFTASADTAVIVDVANILTVALARVGIVPSGGSVFYVLYDVNVPAGDAITGIGPLFLQNGDKIQGRTSVNSALTFSVTGVKSS